MNPRDARHAIHKLLKSDLSPAQADATALYAAPAYAAPGPGAGGVYETFRDGFDQYLNGPAPSGLPYYACRCKGPADRLLAGFSAPTTLRAIAALLLGDAARGAELVPDSTFHPDALFDPRSAFLLPEGMRLPTWEDPVDLDRFGRDQLAYWTARALERANNVPGCVMGVTSSAFCELGKDGGPGQCCEPTADPFPSKPYFYVLASGRSCVDVGRDFGRNENGWIELRRANADDPDGFIKQTNGWCVWKTWEPGKKLRIPGTWNEAEFTPRVTSRLVDGWGRPMTLAQIQGKASLFLQGIPSRWPTPLHMLLELAGQDAHQPGFSRSLEHDEVMAKRLVERTFHAK